MNSELITEIKFPTFKQIYKQLENIDQEIEIEAMSKFNLDEYKVKFYETKAITYKDGEGQYDPMYDFKDILVTVAKEREQLIRNLYLKANLIYTTKINTCSSGDEKTKIVEEFHDLYKVINEKRLNVVYLINKFSHY
ncbi:hypothetical protein [Rossellomorea sp. DA94]|uniref:hypothetical protein n=1 Tax=Rossellomorea sp. DA94 TaxID=3038653 RepID=UPI002447BFDA|nr:hypothetical protein [Rossellomorea sp. DA94]WGG47673.1 hypothetical protein P8596_10885 [Rossellomorea sp. DA94]